MASLIEKQVNHLIEETRKVVGIQHVFVCNRQGMVLGAWSDAQTDTILFERVGMHILKMMTAMQKRGGKRVDIESNYQHGAMLVRDLGNAFAVFVYTLTNLSLLRMAINIAATQFIQDDNLQKELAQLTRLSDALIVMDSMANELMEEFGERGIGRNKLAELLTTRLDKLQYEFPCLSEVSVSHRGVDLSSLIYGEISPKEIILAWASLVQAICACAATGLGEPTVAKRYQGIGSKTLRQNKKIFDDMGLVNVIPKLEGVINFNM